MDVNNEIVLTVYGHPVMSGCARLLNGIFSLLAQRKDLHSIGETLDRSALYSNYIAQMSVELGCLLTEGANVELASKSGNVLESDTIKAHGLPIFHSPACMDCYHHMKLLREKGSAKPAGHNSGSEEFAFMVGWLNDHDAKESTEKFASLYGWLAGAANPAEDALNAAQKRLANSA